MLEYWKDKYFIKEINEIFDKPKLKNRSKIGLATGFAIGYLQDQETIDYLRKYVFPSQKELDLIS